MNEIINFDYINDFKNIELPFEKFYKKSVNKIKIHFIYMDNNNNIYEIKTNHEFIKDSTLNAERLLYIIKNNQYSNNEIKQNIKNKKNLYSIIKYNFNIDEYEIKNFLDNSNNCNNFNNFLTIKNFIDNIYFDNTIEMFNSLNSLFIFYKINIKKNNSQNNSQNTTKKIFINDTNKINNYKTKINITRRN